MSHTYEKVRLSVYYYFFVIHFCLYHIAQNLIVCENAEISSYEVAYIQGRNLRYTNFKIYGITSKLAITSLARNSIVIYTTKKI